MSSGGRGGGGGNDRIVSVPIAELPPATSGRHSISSPTNGNTSRVVRMHVSEEWLTQYKNDPNSPVLAVAPSPLLSSPKPSPAPVSTGNTFIAVAAPTPTPVSPTASSSSSSSSSGSVSLGFKIHSQGGNILSSPRGGAHPNGTTTNGMIEMTAPQIHSQPQPQPSSPKPLVQTKTEVVEEEEAIEGKRRGVSRRPVDWKQGPKNEKTLNYLIKYGTHRGSLQPSLSFSQLSDEFDVNIIGRQGNPKEKLVVFDCAKGFVSWSPPTQGKCSRRGQIKVILLKEITDIRKGKHTPAFLRPKAKKVEDRNCVSVFTSTRSLSLVAPNEEDRNGWYDRLTDTYVAERAQHNGVVRDPLMATLAGVMGTLDSDVRKTWTKGMRGAPSYMIAKDFHRLAHNFAVYVLDRDPTTTGTVASSSASSPSSSSSAPKDTNNNVWQRIEGDGKAASTTSSSPSTSEEKKTVAPSSSTSSSSSSSPPLNRRRIDECQQRAGSAHNVHAVMVALANTLLDGPASAALIAAVERHQGAVTAGQKENDRMLESLFDETFGERVVGENVATGADGAKGQCRTRHNISVPERGILAILKLCNQNVMFPAVNVLKRTVLPTYGTRDYRGGWRINIEISPNEVAVVHKKRDLSEAGKFSFTWEMRCVLDRETYTKLLRVEMSIAEATFYDDCAGSCRADVATRLLAMSQQSDTAIVNQRLHQADILQCFDPSIDLGPEKKSSENKTEHKSATTNATANKTESPTSTPTDGETKSSPPPSSSVPPPSFDSINPTTTPSPPINASNSNAPSSSSPPPPSSSNGVVHLNASLLFSSIVDDKSSPSSAPPPFSSVDPSSSSQPSSTPAPSPPSFDSLALSQ